MTLSRFTPLRRTGSLRRGKALRAKKPRRPTMRAHASPYVHLVTTLPCINCAAPGPSDPAHMTLGPDEKGQALKVNDGQVVPLCRPCHRYFDGQADGPGNPFREPDGSRPKETRWELAAKWVEETQLLATPGDDFDRALAFAERGLGRIEVEAHGGWVWWPCWTFTSTATHRRVTE